METVNNISKIESKDTKDLVEGIENITNIINKKIDETDWIKTNTINFQNAKLFSLVADLGTCDRKRLKRIINRCASKPNLRNINSTIHFISKTVYNGLTPTNYVKVSVREAKIIAARKKYVESRNTTIALRNEYKEVKGDYYKSKKAI